MTIGDILAVIAAVLLVGVSWAATVLMTGLLFPATVRRAGDLFTTSPGKCFVRGAVAWIVIGLLALAIGHGPGPMRLISYTLLAILATSAAVGSAAIVQMMADRIDGVGSDMAPFARLTRAAALYVGAGFVPVVGWFLILPAALIGTVGAGLAALRKPKAPKTIASQTSLPWNQGGYPAAQPGVAQYASPAPMIGGDLSLPLAGGGPGRGSDPSNRPVEASR